MSHGGGGIGAARDRTGSVKAPLLLLAAAFTLAAPVVWRSADVAASTPTASTRPAPSGQMLYLRDCAVCHGASATGTALGPTLAGVGHAGIEYYVSTGRMPLAPAARTEAKGR